MMRGGNSITLGRCAALRGAPLSGTTDENGGARAERREPEGGAHKLNTVGCKVWLCAPVSHPRNPHAAMRAHGRRRPGDTQRRPARDREAAS